MTLDANRGGKHFPSAMGMLSTVPGAMQFRCNSRADGVPRRKATLFAAIFIALCLTADGESLRIVISGDGRADYPWNAPRPDDARGLNQTVNEAICRATLDEHAKILLWTGDIVNVNDTNPHALQNGLEAWRAIMQPLYDAHVDVWPVRGNHEVYRYVCKDCIDGDPIPNAKSVWKSVFSGRYAVPTDGPKGEENLTFYAVRDSALIIGLDQYEPPNPDPLRRRHSINQTWLDRVLNDTRNKRPFTLVYGHEAAFAAGRHKDDDTLAADTGSRNLFWQSLIRAGVPVYFCGHDHFYDRMSVVRNGSNPGRELFQITAGTAGAPSYRAGDYAGATLWKLQRLKHFENIYGYILVEVGQEKTTITFKGADASNHARPLSFTPLDEIVCGRSGCKNVSP